MILYVNLSSDIMKDETYPKKEVKIIIDWEKPINVIIMCSIIYVKEIFMHDKLVIFTRVKFDFLN